VGVRVEIGVGIGISQWSGSGLVRGAQPHLDRFLDDAVHVLDHLHRLLHYYL
jgi:hypothetical protein